MENNVAEEEGTGGADGFFGFSSEDDVQGDKTAKRLVGELFVAVLAGLLLLGGLLAWLGGYQHNRVVTQQVTKSTTALQHQGTAYYVEDGSAYVVKTINNKEIRTPKDYTTLSFSTTTEGTLVTYEVKGECVWWAPCPEKKETEYVLMVPKG